jgi:putative endonuclease
MNNRDFGTRGEDFTASYLTKLGWTILARNFRAGRLGELDIVARDGEYLAFVEVKTRSGNQYGTPGEAVSYAKQANIRRLAQAYMERYKLHNLPVRFDVAELLMDRDGTIRDINLIKNAF